MNIEELAKQKKETRYVTVKGRAEEEYVQAVTAFGVEPEKVIEQAYRELYDQLSRRGLLHKLGTNGRHVEAVPKPPARGDAFDDEETKGERGSKRREIKERILQYMDREGVNFFQMELADRFGTHQTMISLALRELISEGKVREAEGMGKGKRYWLAKYGDPNLQEFASMNQRMSSQ